MKNFIGIFIFSFLFLNFNLANSMAQDNGRAQGILNELSVYLAGKVRAIAVISSDKLDYEVQIEVDESSDIQAIANYLNGKEKYLFSTLEVICVNNSKIGDDGAKKIAEALREYKGLEKLILANCGIENEGAKALTDAILNQINKSEEQFSNLINSYGSNQSKEKIYILKCLNDCGTDFSEYVNLELEELKIEFQKLLKKKFSGQTGNDYNLILKGTYLKYLDLGKNRIENDGLKEFLKILKKNIFFGLNLNHNNIDKSMKEKIIKIVKCKNGCSFFSITKPYQLINLSLMNNKNGKGIGMYLPAGNVGYGIDHSNNGKPPLISTLSL